jgi:CNT family concentrative nucleoside transporter
VPVEIMAHVHEHNHSSMPGVVANNDPALDIAREHDHAHVHHSARAVHDDHITYTAGTTDDRSAVPNPSAQDHGLHQRYPEKHGHFDLEKNADVDFVEQGTRSSTEPASEEEKPKSKWAPSVLYRRFRLPVHIFIGAFFTG